MASTPRLAEYIIYIPLRYNDGTKIEDDKLNETIEEIIIKFGALTREEANEGTWIYKNKVYNDAIDKIQILTYDTKENDLWFQQYKIILEKRFQQETIFIIKQRGIEIL